MVPRALREAVLKSSHGTTGAGHFDVSKALRHLCQGFYWGQFKRDVEDFCRRTSHKAPLTKPVLSSQQLGMRAPMERVAVDDMSQFPRTEKGNCYVLTAMDYFTKWPEADALPERWKQ